MQENSKTKHPQLLYEAKLYNILQGGSMRFAIRTFFFLSVLFRVGAYQEVGEF